MRISTRMRIGVIHPEAASHFVKALATAITNAFKHLLSDKHLYQSVKVDASCFEVVGMNAAAAANSRRMGNMREAKAADYTYTGEYVASWSWKIENQDSQGAAPTPRSLANDETILFELPTIHTTCAICAAFWPFNPSSHFQESGKMATEQWFFLSYRCQSCKSDSVRFLVRRSGTKLTLSGRDPIEAIPPPKVLPKAHAQHYSSAQVQRNAGQILPAIFMLRVFIEQFWRGIPRVSKLLAEKPRATGDEMGVAYNAGLPDDFKTRFPSLLGVYNKLSEAIHNANASETIFDECAAQTVEHFEARRVFKITDEMTEGISGKGKAGS